MTVYDYYLNHGDADMTNITESVISKITDAALTIMATRASIEESGRYGHAVYTADDIAAAVAADPTGNTAFRLAELVVSGIQHYAVFAGAAA